MKVRMILTITILLVMVFYFGQAALAATQQELVGQGLDNTAKSAQMKSDSPNLIRTVGTALSILLSSLSVFFLVIALYGGITWMFSAGSEDQITKAKSTLINGAIGMAVCLTAWGLSQYVTLKMVDIFMNTTT